jgi:hypothetical protein
MKFTSSKFYFMLKKIVIISALIASTLPAIDTGYTALQDPIEVGVVTNCNGMQVVRVAPGRFEIRSVAQNTPGCINAPKPQAPVVVTPPAPVVAPVLVATGVTVSTGSTSTGMISTGMISTGTLQTVGTVVTNCNGTRITPLSGSGYAISRVEQNLPGCLRTDILGNVVTGPNLSHGPLLDLASTDIVNYRVTEIKEQGVRFANALRSVRMRAQASRASRTNTYLMRNDAVVVSGNETGWVKVQGADVVVTDTHENTVAADTTGKADGYTASKYLRDPNANDLVTIEQADHAYWSDIAHVNVRYANLRSNPWYTAPIVTTVDNWSQVRNDEGTLRGYIRSDLLTIDLAQRVDNPNTGKVEMTPASPESSSDSPWIGF